MKLLRISATGLPLFQSELVFSFVSQQRVQADEKESFFKFTGKVPFYLNNANAIIGINASGKTSVLKVILLALDILNNEPINHCKTKDILGDSKDATLVISFLSDVDEICQLETHIEAIKTENGNNYRISSETLKTKPLKYARSKVDLFDFTEIESLTTRSDNEAFLADDISIIIAYNKKNNHRICIRSLLSMTNVNVLPFTDNISLDIIQYLDPTVDYLRFDELDKKTVHLKFKGKDEIILSDSKELGLYLSSGTIKGIVTFTYGIQVIRNGGYLVADELENHFNKEIASTLIRFFLDPKTNPKGGSLVFSTHYSEIIDEFSRNDCIFVTRNINGITMTPMNQSLKRNDIKKSDAYQSDMLRGTAPSYDAYIRLRKNLLSVVKSEASDV